MRALCLFIMLCVSLVIIGQSSTFRQESEQKAIKSAYDVLRVYYPSDKLCVSDSIYDLDWDLFSDMVDSKTKEYLQSHRIEKGFVWDSPIRSDVLSLLFPHDTCVECNRTDKYIAEFSEPYKGMIRCDVLPKNREIGIHGTPQISIFLFKYNIRGEIYQFSKREVDID